MKRPLLLTILAMFLPSQPAALAQSAEREIELVEKIDTYLAPYLAHDLFSGVLLVAQGDEILVHKSYGMANYEHEVPNTTRTRFRIASLSKVFTKLAVIQLVEQGQLHWDDPLSKFIPDYPRGSEITVQHLVSHRSGIPHLNDFPNYDDLARLEHSLDDLIALFKNEPIAFVPGSQEAYSNSGYVLLAFIIQQASGMRYGNYLQTHIFEPAGMERTAHERYGPVIKDKADGYMPSLEGPGVQRALFVDPSIKIGGGSLYATAEDLFRFDRAYREGRLSRSTEPLYDEGIEGRSPGFNAMMWGNGEYFIVALSNNYVPVIRRISIALIYMVLGREFEVAAIGEPATVSASLLDEYNGDYHVDGDTISIRRSGEVLIQYEDDDRWRAARLIPLSRETFFDPWYWEKITFVKDASGKVTGFRWEGDDAPGSALSGQRITR